MKKTFKSLAFVILLIVMLSLNLYSQNAIVGSGFSTGWGGVCPTTGNSNFNFLVAGIGTTYILTTTANGTGNQYWRYGIDWDAGATTAQWMATGGSPDLSVSPSTTYSLNTSCTTSGALYYNVPNTSYNYVFKTLNAGSSPTGTIVFFEVQGAVQTISSVAQSPTSANVFPGQSVLVTATTSGTSTGQNFYLRYTNDAWATSSVLSMTGGGTSYTATIPASVNTANKVVAYYVFSSGPSNVATNGSNADLFTINLNNNTGSNYSYTVQAGWTTTADGNWSTAGTWTANAIPSNSLSLGTITIAHNVTQDQNGTGTVITINSSKTLTINGTFTLTASGASTVNGTIANAGTVAVSGGSWTFASTGKYQHNYTITAGTIPTATWIDGSTCEIIGYTSYTASPGAPSGINQSFYNLTWNCASQAGTINFRGTIPSAVRGNFSYSAGGGILQLSASENYTLNISGNFSISSGTLELATSTATSTVNISGNYTQTGGVFNLANGGAAIITVNIAGDFSNTAVANALRKSTGTAIGKIVFNKSTGSQTFSSTNGISTSSNPLNIEIGNGTSKNPTVTLSSNIAINSSASFTLFSGSTLEMGTYVLSGGTFTLNTGGTIKIGSPEGITTAACGTGASCGNVRTTNRTFVVDANYVYNGVAAQFTGNGLTGANTLTISNSNGVKLSSSLTTVSNLQITSGTFDLNGSNNITLVTSSGTLTESSGNNIINTGSPGAGNGYIEITKTLNAPSSDNPGNLGLFITTASNLGSTNIKRFHKVITQNGLGGAGGSVSKYYLLSPTSSGTGATLVFSYFDSELNGNSEGASPVKLNLWNSTSESSGYAMQGSTSTDATANTVTLNSVSISTTATYWTVATNSYATINPTTQNWSDGTTWAAGSPPPNDAEVTISSIVIINTNPTCSSITINSGKILQYENTTTPRTLTVTGDMTVNGTFKTGPQDATVSHLFILGGNLIIGNAATFDLRAATSPSLRKTLTTFDGSSNVTISSPGTPSQVDFAEITINKSASTNKVTYTISTINPTLPGTGGNTITWVSGLWEQSVGTITFGTSAQDIPGPNVAHIGGLQITESGNATFGGGATIRKNGTLLVNTSGTVNIGDGSGERLELTGTVGQSFNVTFQSGTVNIAGRMGDISGAPGNLWKGNVTISGATVNLCTVGMSNNDDCVFCTPASGTGTFTMSSGNLNILQANQGAYAGADLDIIDATSTISGGTITIGNGGSSGSVNFDIGSTENLNLLVVNSGALTVGTLTDLTITNASSPLTITTGNIDLKGKTINLNNVNNGVAITVSGANRTVTSGTGTGYINISSDNSSDVKTISYLASGELTIGSGAVLRIGSCQLNYVTTSSCTFASNGTFEILSGGSVTVAAPTYASGSYLKYSTNSSFNRDAEWNTPHHVIVTNTFGATDVHMGNNAPELSLTMNGNLTIQSGSTMFMNAKTGTLTIGGNATVNGTLNMNTMNTYIRVNGNLLNSSGTITLSSSNGGDFHLYGDFQNDGTFTCNERAVYFKGTTTQTVSGTNAIVIDYMRIENGVGGSITLSREVAIDNEVSFVTGIVTSSLTNILTFNSGAIINASDIANDNSFVNGPVKKIGNTDFTFPIGKNTNYQPITTRSITGGVEEAFTAEYSMANPQTAYGTSKDGTIDHLSQCEYWVLNRSNSQTAIVEATFDANSCGVTSLPDLILARWNGSQWKDHTGVCTTCYTGNTTTGTVYSNAAVTSFSPFTLASKTAQPNNPLPIDLLNFNAKYNNKKVVLTWATLSETNNDYFTIEKSNDGYNFTYLSSIDGAGNSNTTINYEYTDPIQTLVLSEVEVTNNKQQTVFFYRLKQTDFDGKYSYSNIKTILNLNNSFSNAWYNNNENSLVVNINSLEEIEYNITIYDLAGKELVKKASFVYGNMTIKIPNEFLSSGVYIVSIVSENEKTNFRIIINK